MGEPTGEIAPTTNGVPASRAAARAATIAALQAGPVDDAPSGDAVEAAPAELETAAAPADSGDADVASTPPPEKAAEAEKPDAETDKRLARVQAAAKRAEDAIAKREAALEQREKALEAKAIAAEKFGSRKERIAAGDRSAFLEAMEDLGLSDDHFEDHAKLLYANRKGAEPKDRAAAVALLEKREVRSEASKALTEVEKLRAEIRQRDEAAEAAQLQHAYLTDVKKTATLDTTEAPRVKTAIAKNPTKVTTALWKTANEIFQTEGEWPDSATVVAAYEKELDDLGFPVVANGNAPKAVVETKRSTTLGTEMAGSTKTGGPKKSLQEQREETRALIAAGKVE